ncbi:carbohydrate ABC transporter permease [Kitasatospora cineracea]|uniref:Carbohydrate ABC transporter membrane protein 2 (CUT1 family) n=1 Tax=Kitasatospora cineracea TaxID=88074 RepID=A0A8G1XDJ8_9ACTN|nr:carbohydrate ABC transporter permease [Kitasatospora cineracea]ROR46550.1 carbohydrate ABC transporter membrane protein 2 (CUT1 family) [Kitasatospora cineracea]
MTAPAMSTEAEHAAVKSAPVVGRRRRKAERGKQRSSVLTVIIWLTVLYFIVPLLWLVISSTKDNADLFTTFGLKLGHSFQLFKNLGSLFTFQDGIYSRWLINTVLYAVVGSVGAAVLSTMAGYALAKYRFPGSRAVFNIVLGSIMVPLTALALPTYLLFAAAHLTDTPWAVILPSLVSPFGVYLMRVYAADAVDDSILEAARIDGASEFRVFRTISLKLLTPGIVTVLLFQLVATWNNYFLPLIMLNSPKLFPVTVGLAQWQGAAAAGGGAQVLFSTVITGAFVSIIPLMIAFLFLQRYWQSGLATGGVKG